MSDSHYTVKGKLETYYPSFTKSEQKVASAVLSLIGRAEYASVTELAQMAGVGEATVVRLCRKIGYKGYHDFKMALAKESPKEAAEQPGHYTERILQQAADNMNAAASFLDLKMLGQAAAAIAAAECIHLFGTGASAVGASAAQHCFWQAGKRAYVAVDPNMYGMMTRGVAERDVAIGICESGEMMELQEALQEVKSKGAAVIVLTHYAAASVTEPADYVFVTTGDTFFHTYMSQLFIVECLLKRQKHPEPLQSYEKR